MIVEDENLLKAWIARDVESSTDADADALAKYVIALVKKPLSDSELEKLCLDKLFVFLQSNTKSFVERLFRCLSQGLYLPASTRLIPSPPGVDHDAGDDHIILDAHGSEDEDNGASEKTEESPQKKEKEKRSGETSTSSGRDAKEKPKSSPSKTGLTSATSRPQRRRISPPPSSTPLAATESTKDRDSSLASKDQRPSEQRRKAISPPARDSRKEFGSSRRGASGYSSGVDRSGRTGRSERYHRRARSRERSWSRSRSRSRSASRSRSPHRSEYEPTLRRRRCRDFHEKGYCTRGDKCAYDHGPDPVVIDNNAFDAIVSRSGPPPPISANALTSTAMGVPSYNPMNPPPPGLETKSVFGTSPSTEPYNPEAPALTTSSALATKMDFSVPPPPLPGLPYTAPRPATALAYGSAPAVSTTGLVTVVGGPTAYNPAQSTRIRTEFGQDSMVTSTAGSGFGSNFSGYTSQSQTSMSSGPPTSFASRGRGMRGSRFKPYGAQARINPALCSLLVKKIPPEQNKIVMLDQHFGKFGQITNLHVQYQGQPDTALVTFKTRRDAMNAMRSTEPIFNNRFIKVFWQTEQEQLDAGEGNQGLETTAAGLQEPGTDASAAPLIPTDLNRAFSKTFGAEHQPEEPIQEAEEPKPAELKPATTEPSQPRAPAGIQTHLSRPVYNPRSIAAKRKSEKDSLLKMIELQKKKTEIYAKLVENQRDLAQKIQSTDNEEVKKKYKELFKKLDQSTRTTKDELEKLREQILELQKKLQEYAKRPFGQISNAPKATNGNEHGSASPESNEKLTKTVSALQLSSAANNKKLFRVVHVSGCPIEQNEDLIVHMEKFGELFDFDIAPRNKNAPCAFTYKNAVDAQRAVTEASNFAAGGKLKVEWAPVSLGQQPVVIPDKERDPTEQVQAAQLLAALGEEGDDDEDDEELSDNEHNANGSSHQEEGLDEDE